jgi:uncharacterized protein with GYD domain
MATYSRACSYWPAAATPAQRKVLHPAVVVRKLPASNGQSREGTMARYIILVNWTDQGIRNVKDSPKRLDAARDAAKGLGADIKEFYMTMGDHDMVVVTEAPNDEAMAKFILRLGSTGNVRTKTLKAFAESEYRSIIGSLP